MSLTARTDVASEIVRLLVLQNQWKGFDLKVWASEKLSDEIMHQAFTLAFCLAEQAAHNHFFKTLL